MTETLRNIEIERAEAWKILETEMFAPFFENDEQKERFLQECFDGTRKFPWHLQGQSIGVTNSKASIAAIEAGGLPVLGGTGIGRMEYEEIANKGLLNGTSKKDRKELGFELNERVLLEEIEKVRKEFPHAILGVNILHAAGDFEQLVRAVGEQGMVDMLYVGAGLPRDLSKIMEDYPKMRYLPIVSSASAVRVLESRGEGERRPDGYVFEAKEAAGHNASIREGKLEKTKNENVLEMKKQANGKPIIVAGGIRNQKDIQEAVFPEELDGIGANGIGLGTRGLLTQESGVDTEKLKATHLNPSIPVLRREKFSSTGLPSTGKVNHAFWAEAKLRRTEVLKKCNDCLNGHCKFVETKGESEDYPVCLATSLVEELKGGDYGMSFMGEVDELESIYRDKKGNPSLPFMKRMIEHVILNDEKTVEEVQPLISDVFSKKKIA